VYDKNTSRKNTTSTIPTMEVDNENGRLQSDQPHHRIKSNNQQNEVVTMDSIHSSDPMASNSNGIVIKKSTTTFVLLSGVTLLTICIGLAKIGILPGDNGIMTYTNEQILQDTIVTIGTSGFAYAFVKFNTWCVAQQYMIPRDARKVIHTLSAPLFILLWPLYTNTTIGARYFAVIVPILNALRLYFAATIQNNDDEIRTTKSSPTVVTTGSNNNNENELALAISRSGDVREALGGPFIYVMMLMGSVVLFWKHNPVGIIAMCCMACGDGMADIIGRRYGSMTGSWSFNPNKSIAGSMAFVLSSILSSIGLLSYLQYFDPTFVFATTVLTTMDIFLRIVLISFMTAGIEVLPIQELDDNYTVPISAVILSLILFPIL
jgi:dolichol kinase